MASDPARWRILSSHLDQLMDLPSAECARALAALAENDTELARDLSSLMLQLKASEREAFLERGPTAQLLASATASTGAPRYALDAEHARGGMGRILRAQDTLLERVVAIKELLSPSAAHKARFEREAKLTARLQHPSIIPVYDAGGWALTDSPWYAMKLVSGSPLRASIDQTRSLPERLACLPSVLAAADAVAYAHSEGVIHRDIKPDNILVGDYGETLVVDWGLAKDLRATGFVDESAGAMAGEDSGSTDILTIAGTILGTPAFMPPEQAAGHLVDQRADVYALGATLYFLIAGHSPYDDGTSSAVLARVIAGPPPRLLDLQPDAPADLCAIAETAMARSVSDRYADGSAFARDLRSFLTGQLVSAHDYSWRELVVAWVKRHRTLTALSLVFGLVVLLGSTVFLLREQRLRLDAEQASRRADAQSRALSIEHGQRELDSGHPLRAAAYLAGAYAQEPDNARLQHMVTEVIPALSAHGSELRGHTRDVVAVAFSSDGTRIVTGSTDQTVRLWRAESGALERILHGPEHSVEDVAISHDGKLVASAEQAICIWSSESGQLLHRLPYRGFRIAFSRDGRWLAAGSMRGELRVWDTTTWQLSLDVRPYRDRLAEIAFHPSGLQAVTVSWDGIATIWSLPDWKPLRTHVEGRSMLTAAQYSPDGRWLLIGDNDSSVYVRDAQSGALMHVLRLPDGARGKNVFFGPDGRTIVTATTDGVLRIWHAASGSLLYAIDAMPQGKMFDSALAPDGRLLVTVGLHGGDTWHLERLATARIVRGEIGAPTSVSAAIFSRDGRRIVAGIERVPKLGYTLYVWDSATGAELAGWPAAGSCYRIASCDDLSKVVSGFGRNLTAVYDARTGDVAQQLMHDARFVRGLAMSRDCRLIASGADPGQLLLWRDGVWTEIPTGIEDPEMIAVLTFTPDERQVVVGDSRGDVSFFEVATGALTVRFKASPTQVEHIAFSADGRWMVTAGRQDHTAKVWNVATHELRATLTGHSDNLVHASFSPDAARVATASVDNTVRLWDARSGVQLRVIRGPSSSAQFSPDGRELLTTGLGDYIVLWQASVERPQPSDFSGNVRQHSPWRVNDGRLALRGDL